VDIETLWSKCKESRTIGEDIQRKRVVSRVEKE
jgi:hypothetical protein